MTGRFRRKAAGTFLSPEHAVASCCTFVMRKWRQQQPHVKLNRHHLRGEVRHAKQRILVSMAAIPSSCEKSWLSVLAFCVFLSLLFFFPPSRLRPFLQWRRFVPAQGSRCHRALEGKTKKRPYVGPVFLPFHASAHGGIRRGDAARQRGGFDCLLPCRHGDPRDATVRRRRRQASQPALARGGRRPIRRRLALWRLPQRRQSTWPCPSRLGRSGRTPGSRLIC